MSRPSGLRRALVVVIPVLMAVGTFLAAGRGRSIADPMVDWAQSWLVAPEAKTTPIPFTVEAGENARSIGQRLAQQGLIRSSLLFRVLARYYGLDDRLAAGEYQLTFGMTMGQIIQELRQGQGKQLIVTIPEGWRAEEIADLLEKEGIAEKADFLILVYQSVGHWDLLPIQPEGHSLEGYLFPDTYWVPPHYGSQPFLKLMLENFAGRFDQELRDQARARGMTVHETLTLASIVEREAKHPEERATIAGVFLNRLRLGMPLEADPTVQYALAQDGGTRALHGLWKPMLEPDDLNVDSPYNTYRHAGLPPGPIGNPGLAALRAVLWPEETDYLYFVAREDGSHAFTSSLEEHLANVARNGRQTVTP